VTLVIVMVGTVMAAPGGAGARPGPVMRK